MGSIAVPVPVRAASSEESFEISPASYPKASTAPLPEYPEDIKRIASQGINALNDLLDSRHYSTLHSLLHTSRAYWRDHLGLCTTKLSTLVGATEIVNFIHDNGPICPIQNFTLEENKHPEMGKVDPPGMIKTVQAFITFETATGLGRGLISWVQDVDDGDLWKIFTIYTVLSDLKDSPFATGFTRPKYANPQDVNGTKNWKVFREENLDFEDAEPTVLIVGAGHSGLMTAARLNMIGISNLIIDRQKRSGDVWRTRYHKLVLHDPCWMNAMPYLAYPSNWPIYASKDKQADFLEYYESALELNLWNSTQIVESQWHAEKQHWTVVVETRRKGYKETRTFRPRHIVQATGLNGDPRVPRIPGVGGFQGSVKHSSEFSSGASYAGRKVIVVGTGNSGHDIAHDACMSGANVTMIQRSHTYVVSVPSTLKMFQVRYNEGRATEDSDILSSAIPTTLSQRQGGDAAANFAKEDAKLLSALNAAGFKTHPGPEFPSLLAITIAKTRGFYLNTGTSELIISQKIAVKQGQEISRITPTSMVFPDGSEIEADEIIFATGYANVRSRTRTIFGDSVADKIQPIGGFDEQGEIRGVWRRSGHDGFWVGAGSFYVSRYYSKLLALQIKMIEKGLVAL